MPLTFSVVSQERADEVLNFLREVFGITEIPPNLSPETQVWKYFAAHPWWPTSRSYIFEGASGIASHGCIAPIRFAYGDTALESMVIIDWASSKFVPGAGLFMYRRCMEIGGSSLLAIGGSDDTLRILPQVRWFVAQVDMQWYARPMRPWRRFLRSKRGIRDLIKFSRNVQWNLFPQLPPTGEWSCRRARIDDPVFTPSGDFAPILRTRAWINYLAACPAAKCTLWILENQGQPSGHALIANLKGSARVADFALAGPRKTEEVEQAFSVLVRTLQTDDAVVELVAGSSLAQEITAFQACGLRYRRSSRVLLADPRKTFPEGAVIEIKPMLGDGFYLHNPANPFLL
jgi:hypothetical protein